MEGLKVEPEVSVEERLTKVEGDVANIINRQDQIFSMQEQNAKSIGVLASTQTFMQQSMMTFIDSMKTLKDSYEATQEANKKMWNNIKGFFKRYWLHILSVLGTIALTLIGFGYWLATHPISLHFITISAS